MGGKRQMDVAVTLEMERTFVRMRKRKLDSVGKGGD